MYIGWLKTLGGHVRRLAEDTRGHVRRLAEDTRGTCT